MPLESVTVNTLVGFSSVRPSMRSVGYRQAWQYLDGAYGLPGLRDKAVAATRQLAKRQLTWLRAMDALVEFDCLSDDLGDQVCDHVAKHLASRN